MNQTAATDITMSSSELAANGVTDDAALFKAAQITHTSFEDLQDTEEAIQAFAERTLQMAGTSDEEWRSQYDALDNLRVLNKFHGDSLPLDGPIIEFVR